MANTITIFRILASIAVLFCPVFTAAFYSLYLTAGLSDMLDGAVARRTNTVSAFGSRLDTIADIVFVAVCMIKWLPVMDIPLWLCLWIGMIALLKVINIVSGFIVQKRFVAAHTVMNKLSGALLFLFPLTLSFIEVRYSVPVVCGIATLAAIQEGHLIRTGKMTPPLPNAQG